MPETELPIIESGTPDGLCYTTLSADIPIIAQYLRAIFSGNEINTGSSTPAAEDRDKPWFRKNSDGTPDGVWVYSNGFWLKPHSDQMVGHITFAPVGTASTDIDALDGGETAAISNMTGPFWSEVTELRARSPIHPGTLPSGTVINPGDSLGEEKHIQVLSELIEHSHIIKAFSAGAIGGDGGHILNEPDPATDVDHSTEPEGDDPPEGMNIIHPVYALYAIQRTARLYYRRPG